MLDTLLKSLTLSDASAFSHSPALKREQTRK